MADESNVLGIQATIDSSTVEQGANQFVQKINEMEAASNKVAKNISQHFEKIAKKIMQLSQIIDENRQKLSAVVSDVSRVQPSNSVSLEAYQKLQKELEEALKKQAEVKQNIQTTTSSLSEAEGVINTLSGAVSNVTSLQIAQAQELYNQFNSAKSEYLELNSDFEKLDQTLDNLRAKQSQVLESKGINSKKYRKVTAQVEELEKKWNDVGANLKSAYDRTKELEEEFNKLGVNLKTPSEQLAQLRKEMELLAANSKLGTKEYIEKKKKVEELIKVIKQLKKDTQEEKESIDSNSNSISKYNHILSLLPQPIQNIINGFRRMTQASMEFIATPIGAVIGAIVGVCLLAAGAIKTMNMYLTQTIEGEMEMTKINGAMMGIQGKVNMYFAEFGKKLYDSLKMIYKVIDTSPALKSFFKNAIAIPLGMLINNLDNAAKALENFAQLIDAISNGDWGKVASVSTQIMNDIKNFNPMQRWKDVISKGNDFLDEVSDNVDKAQKIASDEEKIRREEIANLVATAQKEKEISELRMQIYETQDKRERKRLIEQTKRLIDEKTNMQLSINMKKLMLAQERQAISPMNVADVGIEAQAIATYYRTEQQRASEKRFFSRMESSINQSLGKDVTGKVEAYKDQLIDLNNEMAERAEKYAQDLQARRITLMQEGAEKDIAQIELNTEKEKIALETQLRELAKRKRAVDDALWASKHKGNTPENNKNRKSIEEYEKEILEATGDSEEAVFAKNYLSFVDMLAANEIDQKMAIYDKIAETYRSNVLKRQRKELKTQTDVGDLMVAKKLIDREIENQEHKDVSNASDAKREEHTNRLINLRMQLASVTDALTEAQYRLEHSSDELLAKYDLQSAKIVATKPFDDEIKNLQSMLFEAENKGQKDKVETIQKAIAEATKERYKAEISVDFEFFKKDPKYAMAFDDMANSTTKTLQEIIDKFAVYIKNGLAEGLDPSQLQAFMDAYNSMMDEMIGRDPFEALKQSATEVAEAEIEVVKAQERLNEARDKSRKKTQTVEDDEGNVVATLYSEADAEAMLEQAQNNLSKARNRQKKAIDETCNAIDNLASSIRGVGDAIGGVTGEILGFISDTMNFATQTIQGIETLSTQTTRGITGVMKAVESASVILAIVGAAIQLTQTFSKLLPTEDSYYQKAVEKQKKIKLLSDAVYGYRMAVLEAQQAEKNWFATTGLQSMQDAYEKNGMIVEKYYDSLYKAQERYKDKSSGLSKATPYLTAAAAIGIGAVTGGLGSLAVGALAGSIGSGLGATIIGAAVDGVAGAIIGNVAQSALSYKGGQTSARDNLRIQTQHASFWRGEKTKGLEEWVKDNLGANLFEEDGLVNLEAAEQVLDKYGDKLVGQTKETLEELVELRKQYDEYLEGIREFVSEMFNPLVDNMTDAFYDWLATGKDVMDSFKDYASDTFANLAKTIVKQQLLGLVFDGYEDKMEKITDLYARKQMSEDEYFKAIMDSTQEVMNSAQTHAPIIQETLQKLDDMASELGFDISSSSSSASSSSTSSKGVGSMSQDTADELNGRFTALQISNEGILQQSLLQTGFLTVIDANIQYVRENLISKEQVSEVMDIQRDSVSYLETIATNSRYLKTMNENLEYIKQNTKKL